MTYDELKEIVVQNGFMIEELSSHPEVYIYAHENGFSNKCGNFSNPLVNRVWATAIMTKQEVSLIRIYDKLNTNDSGLLFEGSGKDITKVTKTNVNLKCISIAKKIKKELMKNKLNKIKNMF
jgi:hypothetical protein